MVSRISGHLAAELPSMHPYANHLLHGALVTLRNIPASPKSAIPDLAKGECKVHDLANFSTRIKDAGIAIRHARGYIISILQGPETDLREWKRCVDTQKTENHIRRTLFSYGKF